MKKITTIGMALMLGGLGFMANAQVTTGLSVRSISWENPATGTPAFNSYNNSYASEYYDLELTPDNEDSDQGQIPESLDINFGENLSYTFLNQKPGTTEVLLPVIDVNNDNKQLQYGEGDDVDYAWAVLTLIPGTSAGSMVANLSFDGFYEWLNSNVASGYYSVTIPEKLIQIGTNNYNLRSIINLQFTNSYITPSWEGVGAWNPAVPYMYIGATYTEDVNLTLAAKTQTCTLVVPGGKTLTNVYFGIYNWGGTNTSNKNSMLVNLLTTYINTSTLKGYADNVPDPKDVEAGLVKTIFDVYGYGEYTITIPAGTVTYGGLGNSPINFTYNFRAVQQGQTPSQVNIYPLQNDGYTVYNYNALANDPITIVYEFEYPVSTNKAITTGVFKLYQIVNGKPAEKWYYSPTASSIVTNGNYVTVTIPQNLVYGAGDYQISWVPGGLTVAYPNADGKTTTNVYNAQIDYNFSIVAPSALATAAVNANSYFPALVNNQFTPWESDKVNRIQGTPNPDYNVYSFQDFPEVLSYNWADDQYVFLANSSAKYTITTPKSNLVYTDNIIAGNYTPLTISYTNDKNEEVNVADVADFPTYFQLANIQKYINSNGGYGKYTILIPEGTFVMVKQNAKGELYGELNKGITIEYTVAELVNSVSITPDPYYTSVPGMTGNPNIYPSSALGTVTIAFGAPIQGGEPVVNPDTDTDALTINGRVVAPVMNKAEGTLVLDLKDFETGEYTIVIPTGYVEVGNGNYNNEIVFSYEINNLDPEPIINFQNGEIVPLEAAEVARLVVGWKTDASIQLAEDAYVLVNGDKVELIDNDYFAKEDAGNMADIPGIGSDEEGEPVVPPTPEAEEGEGDGDDEAPFYNAIVVNNIIEGYTGEVTITVPAGTIYTGEGNYLVYNDAVTVTVNVVELFEVEPFFEIEGTTIQAYWSAPVLSVNEDVTPLIVGEDDFEYELTPGYIDVVRNLDSQYIARVDFALLGALKGGIVPGNYTLVVPEAFVTLEGTNGVDMINLTVYYEFTLTDDFELVGGHEYTAIESIGSSNVVEGVYNLQGVKMSNDLKSLTPGLYIINGKKVLIRK
ncbi:MAG: hypothetical protein J1F67_11155 [Muribaculaceae bacterium]|nr:hypothetical protein [Muribaculaceae bacterium]